MAIHRAGGGVRQHDIRRVRRHEGCAGAELMRMMFRRPKAQRGQAIVLMGVMLMFVMAGGVGLGVDALIGYVQSLSAERAAAAAALAGVVYMPNQLHSPAVN